MEELSQNVEDPQSNIGSCPLCEGTIIETKKAFSCGNWKENGCQFAVWKSIAGRDISQETASQLIKEGSIPKLEGFISKKGAPFSAGLKLDDEGKVKFVFEKRDDD